MIDGNVFLGLPLSYGKLKIYPPTVKQAKSDPNFNQYVRILTMAQEEIEDEYVEKGLDLSQLLTPFEFLLANCYNSKVFAGLTRRAFLLFFNSEPTFLYDQKVIVLNSSILEAKETSDIELINEDNFFDIQNLVRDACGLKRVERPNPNEHPRIKKMKAKARLRDRIKAKQNNGTSFDACLIAICCMGIGITPLNIGELSYASVSAIIETYQNKEKYQIDIDSLLAGADSKKINISLVYNIFSVSSAGSFIWLTRNPQHIMVVGISWENKSIGNI